MSCSSVWEYVERLAAAEGVSRGAAAYRVMLMVKRGELSVEPPASSFLRFLLGPGGAWFWGVAAFASLAFVLALLGGGPLRYVLGGLFVLFLPGYAVVEALYPRGDELRPLERLAFSLGLSLAVVPLLGLVLNFTLGVRLVPVVSSLFVFVVAVGLFAAYRKYRFVRLAGVCG